MEAFTEFPFWVKRAAASSHLLGFPRCHSVQSRYSTKDCFSSLYFTWQKTKTSHRWKVSSLSLLDRYFYGNWSNDVHAFVFPTLVHRARTRPAIDSEVNNPIFLRSSFVMGKFIRIASRIKSALLRTLYQTTNISFIFLCKFRPSRLFSQPTASWNQLQRRCFSDTYNSNGSTVLHISS